MKGEIVELTNRDELKEFLKSHSVVIVKVSATWCGPCKRIAPLVENYYAQLENVSLVMVDADEGNDIVSYLKVKSFPTMINYVNGSMYDILTSSNPDNVKNFFLSTAGRALVEHTKTLEEL